MRIEQQHLAHAKAGRLLPYCTPVFHSRAIGQRSGAGKVHMFRRVPDRPCRQEPGWKILAQPGHQTFGYTIRNDRVGFQRQMFAVLFMSTKRQNDK